MGPTILSLLLLLLLLTGRPIQPGADPHQLDGALRLLRPAVHKSKQLILVAVATIHSAAAVPVVGSQHGSKVHQSTNLA